MESPDLALAIHTTALRVSRRPQINSRLSPQAEEERMLIEPKIHSLIISHIKIISKIYYKTVKDSFNNITINKNIPDEIPEVNISPGEVHLPTFLTENSLTKSNSEARRLITSGAFKIDDIKFLELDIKSEKLLGKTLQIGKRKFLRINNK